ncbi:hypothetical protein [Streptomyces sp. NPDC049040]|uniref:hypothetical protein n=1 Tax=Streptomyces sp. NPDC049040 TaxID=3365593 RepID=UPI003719854D
MKHSRTAVAVATGLTALLFTACGPAGTQSVGDAAPAVTSTPAAVSPSASPSPSSISPSPTTTAPPTTAPPSTSPASVPVTTHATHTAHTPRATHTASPAPRHTTARPVHQTTAPAVSHVCSIRSNAGNCYHAGQFCRNADLGASTTDADGRAITCAMKSGRPHWQY